MKRGRAWQLIYPLNKSLKKIPNLLRYIGSSKAENVTDDLTERLDDIVRETKSKKEVGIRLMKSWEIERAKREDAEKQGMEKGMKEGVKEGRENTLLISIKNLMQTMKLSAEEAMNALMIPDADKPRFRAKL